MEKTTAPKGPRAAVAILALAFAVRLLRWHGVFSNGTVFLYDGDDYYHLRRMMSAASNFPFLPTFDWYLGYPHGFNCPWPPLYDCVASWLGLVVGRGRPTQQLMMTCAAFFPPLAGVATLALFHRACASALNRRAALISLALASAMPLMLSYTVLGRPDHHCFENLWFLAALIFIFKLLEEPPGGQEEIIRKIILAAAAAASLAFGCLFWIGSIYFSGILFVFMLSEFIARSRRNRPMPDGLRWFAFIFLAQIPILLLAGGANPWYRRGSVDFDSLSLFQPLLLATFGLWALCLNERVSHRRNGRLIFLIALATGASAVFAYLGVRTVASFAVMMPRIFSYVDELQPLFGHYPHLTLSRSLEFFGAALWLTPYLALLLAAAAPAPRTRLLLCWYVVTGILALKQQRYGLHFSLPVAMLLGFGLDRALSQIDLRIGIFHRFYAKTACLAFAVILIAPSWKGVRAAAGVNEPPPGQKDLVETCEWIRDHTPPTKSLWKDEGRPEYGIFSLHDIGLQIASIAHRPAVAGNFHTMNDGILDSIKFFFIEDSEQAYRFLADRGFRYVLLTDLVQDDSLLSYARLYGVPGFEPVSAPGMKARFSPRFWDLVYMRLYVADGSRGFTENRVIQGVDHFRLVYESRGAANGVHRYKLFEVVPGSTLKARCRRGLPIEVSSRRKTSQNREWTYHSEAVCTAQGRFEMRLPYAGDWTISRNGSIDRFTISDTDVVEGRIKEL